MTTKTQTFREFADATANPDFTYALLKAMNGGEDGLLTVPQGPPEPDIVFKDADDGEND